MSLTAADLKTVDVQMIRDVAAALEKQATSLKNIKDSFPNLPMSETGPVLPPM
ncbi:hypothetical protein ACRYGW_18455 [Mycobacteroides abscessus]